METKVVMNKQIQKLASNVEDVKTADVNLSAAFLYFSLGIRAMERAEDIFKKYHFNVHEIKQKMSTIEKNFDGVHTLFYAAVGRDKRLEFANDYMVLGEKLDKIIFEDEENRQNN